MARLDLRVTIRPMSLADIPAVAALEEEIFPQPWSAQVFSEELGQANRVYLAAEAERGRIIGYGGLLLVQDDAHIVTLAVAEAFRGRGLGTRLMLGLVEAALRSNAGHLTLEVRLSNREAQGLYRRFGFAPVGLRKHYYADEDALVMWAIDIDTPEYRRLIGVIREGLS